MKWTRLLALVSTLIVGSMTLTACEDDDPVDPPNPPTAPTAVMASVEGTDLTVTWQAVSNADSYRVSVATSGEQTRAEDVSGTEASFSGLTQGATYAVQVTAVNADGQASSEPVTVSIPSPDAPAAPANVTATADGTDVTVMWDAADGADEYRVTLSASGEDARVETTTETSVTFSGLTRGATYAAQVAAINDSGENTATAVTVEVEASVELVSNDILENTTWTSDKVWILTQPIFVGRDCGTDGSDPDCVEATLTIEPGTTVLGRSDVPQGVRGSYLVVSRGSRLVADATGEDRKPTADEVIVFTSDKPRGQRARGDWGGLVVNGQAPTNAGDEAQGEGDSGFYGGTDDNDDSGILRGVRIEFAGDNVTPTDQLNGLALQGVGAGTTISYVQIHYNTDDGIEPFGGTVSVDHLVTTGIGDDSVDGTDGYRGFMQFIVGQQRADNADQGFEISNDGDDGTLQPYSTAVIANATMIGAAAQGGISDLGGESDDGVQFREGSHYRLYNTIIAGFGAGFCIQDAATIVNANNRAAGITDPAQTLSAEGIILSNNLETFCDADDQSFFETDGFNNMVAADLGLDASAYDVGSMDSPPNIIPSAMPDGYTAVDLSTVGFGQHLVQPLDGRTLMETGYAGAVEPGTALGDAWYTGWTVWTVDGADSRPNAEGQ